MAIPKQAFTFIGRDGRKYALDVCGHKYNSQGRYIRNLAIFDVTDEIAQYLFSN